jgi:hypothetical protein
MDFGCPGSPNHFYDLSAGRSSNNRIVNQHDALAFEQFTNGVELYLDAKIPNLVPWFDESPANVMVSYQAKLKGYS